MPRPPLSIWARPSDQSLQLLYLSLFLFTSFCNKNQTMLVSSPMSCGPTGGTCTSTAASIGDPSMCGVGRLGEWQSAPITVALESDHGSSYASLSASPMTASQSHEHCCLFGSHSSSRSICLAPSLLSSPRSSSVSVVGSLGSCSSCSSSSDMQESLGQLTSQWAPNLMIWAASSGMHGT